MQILYFPLCLGKVTVEPGIEMFVLVSCGHIFLHTLDIDTFSTEIELQHVAESFLEIFHSIN